MPRTSAILRKPNRMTIMVPEFYGIADELPNPNTPGLNFDAPCKLTGWPNMVTNAVSGPVYFPEHAGPLSIKCSFGGKEVYETPDNRFELSDAGYLVLNDGQKYSSWIEDDSAGVRSFCLFFQPGLPERVLYDMITPEDRVLDNPQYASSVPLFFEKLYDHDTTLSPLLFSLCKITQNPKSVDRVWLGEQFHRILEALLLVHRSVCGQVERIPAVKPSTRVERFRRLQRAKEYIDANYDQPLSLSEIASVACLSTHHFLRLFKQLYNDTPYRYITSRRLLAARNMLRETDLPVSAICYDLGFESPGSFSWLFRRKVGVSPEQFRFGR